MGKSDKIAALERLAASTTFPGERENALAAAARLRDVETDEELAKIIDKIRGMGSRSVLAAVVEELVERGLL